MEALTPGHKYALDNFEPNGQRQVIQFIQKEGEPLKTIHDGTTNEEVLAMLIDRLAYLGDRLPSRENALAKTRCEEALMWLEKRTADRKSRGVEGTSRA